MAISNSELTIDDEAHHDHSGEPNQDAEATGAEAAAKAEPAAVSGEREDTQALDDLPRDRDPRWGYINLGPDGKPVANDEATSGTEAPAKAGPTAVSGGREDNQVFGDLPRDRDPRYGYIELGSDDEPGANGEATGGTRSSGEGGTRGAFWRKQTDCRRRA